VTHIALGRLRQQAKRCGITQEQIAAAANVGRSLVSHVFAGRAKSSNVVATTRRLIAARQTVGSRGARRERQRRPASARRRSTARALLKHATGWAGGDLGARLAEVDALRSRARV
jgi:transcriptional regulator with XRE-family HTH domain